MLPLGAPVSSTLSFFDFPLRLDIVADIAEHPVVVRICFELVAQILVHTSRGDVDLVVHLESLDRLATVMHLPFSAKALLTGDCTISSDIPVFSSLSGCLPLCGTTESFCS